jgi:WD40 repeat protein
MAALKGHEESVSSVTFSPDGKLLASGSRDGTVRFGNFVPGKRMISEAVVVDGHDIAAQSEVDLQRSQFLVLVLLSLPLPVCCLQIKVVEEILASL